MKALFALLLFVASALGQTYPGALSPFGQRLVGLVHRRSRKGLW